MAGRWYVTKQSCTQLVYVIELGFETSMEGDAEMAKSWFEEAIMSLTRWITEEDERIKETSRTDPEGKS